MSVFIFKWTIPLRTNGEQKPERHAESLEFQELFGLLSCRFLTNSTLTKLSGPSEADACLGEKNKKKSALTNSCTCRPDGADRCRQGSGLREKEEFPKTEVVKSYCACGLHSCTGSESLHV